MRGEKEARSTTKRLGSDTSLMEIAEPLGAFA
jgi:hypothetical protein